MPQTKTQMLLDIDADLQTQGFDIVELTDLVRKTYCIAALELTNNSRTEAAKLLGMNRTTLVESLRRFGLLNTSKKTGLHS